MKETIEQLYQMYQKNGFVTIDSRKVTSSHIFFAVGRKDQRGVHRGSQFVLQAIRDGAVAVVHNDEELARQLKGNASFWVDDAEACLQALGAYHRQQLDIPVIAIAGSNGKTTVKELASAVLAQKYKVFATPGNLNNHLGLPLSLLRIDQAVELAILEIGANHLGETKFLAELMQPDFGLVTNCGKDHLGEYGSFEQVVQANNELYEVCKALGALVFVNGQDELLMELTADFSNRLVFGQPQSDLRAVVQPTPFLSLRIYYEGKSYPLRTQLFGDFWAANVLYALQLGLHFGVPIEQALEALSAYQPENLRSQRLSWKGHKVLLDCYNANPSSMQAFLAAIQRHPQPRQVVILGEMLELGKYSQEEHQKLVNAWIDYTQFEQVILMGEAFQAVQLPQAPQLHYFPSRKALAKNWPDILAGDELFVFVKGSRGNRLEDLFKQPH